MTSREVARAAGVSQATVSRVLSGSDLVKESTREAVLRTLAETGYVVNATARTMRSGRTGVIGVVVSDLANPFYPHLLDALSGAVHAAGYRMMLWEGRPDGEADAVTAIREKAVDSVIFATATAASEPLREAIGRNLPVVLVERSLPGVRCDSVTSDNLAGARNVARYFLGAGRKAIAMIGGVPGTSTADDRLQGFKSGLAEAAKRKPALIATAGGWAYEEGVRAFQEILEHGKVPDAIFCASDVLAFGAMDGARARGLRVPEDLWIAGYDDIAISDWGAYDLTTVRQPLTRMAEQAVRVALDRLADPERAPKRSRLASQLVIRGSTGNEGSAAHPGTGHPRTGVSAAS
ncbi:MAG TPA: LacI family DNA-binding transcriptional regulator [Trebonia sp.]|nr:LacI family DNA-binding transcriptional regulator [Trebonia sp.]